MTTSKIHKNANRGVSYTFSLWSQLPPVSYPYGKNHFLMAKGANTMLNTLTIRYILSWWLESGQVCGLLWQRKFALSVVLTCAWLILRFCDSFQCKDDVARDRSVMDYSLFYEQSEHGEGIAAVWHPVADFCQHIYQYLKWDTSWIWC